MGEPTSLGAVKKTVDCNWKRLLKEQPKLCNRKRSHDSATALPANHGVSDQEESEIWFDDVDDILIDKHPKLTPCGNLSTANDSSLLVKRHSYDRPTKILAIDCEMVGVGDKGEDSILARVSIVNHFGHCLYDKFVKPTETIADYRTPVSGVRQSDLETGADFKTVQKEVSDLLKNRILVGHSIHNDLKALFLDHPKKQIRDTSKYKAFRKLVNGRTPSLKMLCEKLLGIKVQTGEHSSVQDAQAAMRLYTMYRKQWEKDRKQK